MMPPLACDTLLFDLDGTLVDSAPDLLASLNHVLAARHHPRVALEQVRDMVGGGARLLLARAMRGRDAPSPDDAELDEAVGQFIAYYGDHLLDHTRPFPGVAETLAELRRRGFLLAVATNKPEWLTRKLLTGLELAGLFASVVGGDTLPERKPHPLPLRHALGETGGCAAVMVGDSETDVAAARAAGMPVVAVSYGYNRGLGVEALAPDRVIHQFDELARIVTYQGQGGNKP